jgi:hypothetical protein
VLITGGDYGAPGTNAEIYNPITGTFTLTGSMSVPRAQHTATSLNDGQILLAGGFTRAAELYNPGSATFIRTGDMLDDGTSHTDQTATLLQDGTVLIVGGGTRMAMIYDPGTGTFSQTGNLSNARIGHTATLLTNGMVLICGGGNETAEVYNPATGEFTPTSNMSAPRTYFTATLLPDGRVLVIGGYNSSAIYQSTTEFYNPQSGTFSSGGNTLFPRGNHTATLLSSGDVLVIGGHFADEKVIDPITGFSSPATMISTHNYCPAVLLGNGRVLIPGGTDASTAPEAFTELFTECAKGPASALTVSCPADIVQSAEPGQSSAIVHFNVTTTGGIAPVAVSSTVASGAAYPVGTTPVYCTASDASGHTTTCTFNVTVTGDTLPIDVYVGYVNGLRAAGFFPSPWSGDPGVVFVGAAPPYDAGAIRVDNVTGTQMTVDVRIKFPWDTSGVLGAGPGAPVDLWGTRTLTAGQRLIVTETAHDNFDTSDVTALAPVGSTLPDGSMSGAAEIDVILNGTTTLKFFDTGHVLNTGGFDYAVIGNESLQWRRVGTSGLTDPAGNGQPTITCQADTTLSCITATGAPVSYSARVSSPSSATVTVKLKEGTIVLDTQSLLAPANALVSFKPITLLSGAHMLTTEVNDGAVTVSCGTTVTVIQDTTAPVPNVGSLPTITGQTSATVTAPTATDECAGLVTGTTIDPRTYTSQGIFTVHWTFDDGHGNTSSQNQTVIVTDTTPPVISGCPANITANTGAGRSTCDQVVTWTPPTAIDNVAVTSLTSDHNPGDRFPIGTTAVTYTAKDGAGNTATCPFTVTVVDTTPPVLGPCPAGGPYLLNSGLQSLPQITATDNCGLINVAASTLTGAIDTSSLGTKTVQFKAVDTAGNTALQSCSYSVTYQPPGISGTINGVMTPGHQILQPINVTAPYSVFKQGSAIPLKFVVFDANGNSVGTPGLITGMALMGVLNGTTGEVNESIVSTTPDSSFRWDPSNQQWTFHLSSKNLPKNATFFYTITLNDGTSINFQFGLK